MPASIRSEKLALRRQMRATLQAMPVAAFVDAGVVVAATLDALGIIPQGPPKLGGRSSAAVVALFASRSHELSTGPLDALLRQRGLRRCVPRIAAAPTPTLEFVVVDDDVAVADLPRDAMGIPTPNHGERVDLSACDLVVVPGLAFDDAGGRLGYGRGFYDRALVDVDDDRIVAILHDAQWISSVPMEPHDRRLRRLVSDGRVVDRSHVKKTD